MSLTPKGPMKSPTYSIVDNGIHLWWSLLTCWWHHGWIMASLRIHSIKYAPIRMLPNHYCGAFMPLSWLFPITRQSETCSKGHCELCVHQNVSGTAYSVIFGKKRGFLFLNKTIHSKNRVCCHPPKSSQMTFSHAWRYAVPLLCLKSDVSFGRSWFIFYFCYCCAVCNVMLYWTMLEWHTVIVSTHWGRTKWTTLCRSHFQMHFLEWKLLYFEFPGVKLIIFHNGLASDRQQAIIWTSEGLVYRRIYTSLGPSDLKCIINYIISVTSRREIIVWLYLHRFNWIYSSHYSVLFSNLYMAWEISWWCPILCTAVGLKSYDTRITLHVPWHVLFSTINNVINVSYQLDRSGLIECILYCIACSCLLSVISKWNWFV